MPGEKPSGADTAFFADHLFHRLTGQNYLVIRSRRNLSNINSPSCVILCSV